MKRRRVILIAAGCLVAVVAAIVVWPGELEPEYQGKKLSEWLGDLPTGYDEEYRPSARLQEAVRQIGTNALPFLVKWLDCGEWPRWNKLDTAITKVNKRAGRAWTDFKWRRFPRASQAAWAFRVIGPQGSPAIPELVRIVGSTNEHSSACALNALWGIGKEAVPALLGFTTNSNEAVRSYAKSLLRTEPEVFGTNAVSGR